MRGVLFVLFMGCQPTEDLPIDFCEFEYFEPELFDDTGLLSCDRFPNHCHREVTTLIENDNPAAYKILFVGDGFTALEQDKFNDKVDELIAGMSSDLHGLIAMDPTLFNFYRLRLISATNDVTNYGRSDTSLGACLKPGKHVSERVELAVSKERLNLIKQNLPGATVVTIVNSHVGRANSTILLNLSDTHHTLTHELGHALFGLADEYTELDSCYDHSWQPAFSTLDLLYDVPNLSVDPWVPEWQDVVTGSHSGGASHAECIYHPSHSCRMNTDSTQPFCPVCKRHIETVIRHRKHPNWNDGLPTCGVSLSTLPETSNRFTTIAAMSDDYNGIASYTLSLSFSSMYAQVGGTRKGTVLHHGLLSNISRPDNGTITIRCCDTLGACSSDRVEVTIPAPTIPD